MHYHKFGGSTGISGEVASVDSLVKQLKYLPADAIQEACINIAKRKDWNWDSTLRCIGNEASSIAIKQTEE